VTRVDWIALGLVALAALAGLRRGLVASALAIAGVVIGAIVGARVAPHLLPHGDDSPYTPLVALAGAVILAGVLESVGSMVGSLFRAGLRLPPFRVLDSMGGLVLGAVAGVVIVWVVGAALLLIPNQRSLRREVQRSEILQRLDRIVPPRTLLNVLARVDPFPSISGPALPSEPPPSGIAAAPAVRTASKSVVRVLGTACGLGISGSGWVVARGLVVTAAHVVAGERDTVVVAPGRTRRYRAVAAAFDPKNDVAVLRVRGLTMRPLATAGPVAGTPVAIVGYPLNGPLRATAGRMGQTRRVSTEDAYGNGPVRRTISSVAGVVRHGDSGGPAIDGRGRVEATIFAARVGEAGGYAIPTPIVRSALRRATARVSTGECAP